MTLAAYTYVCVCGLTSDEAANWQKVNKQNAAAKQQLLNCCCCRSCYCCNASSQQQPNAEAARSKNQKHFFISSHPIRITCTCAFFMPVWMCVRVWVRVCVYVCGSFFLHLLVGCCFLCCRRAALGFVLHGSRARCLCHCRCFGHGLCHRHCCQATLALRFSSPLQSLLTFSAFAFVRCFLWVSVRSPYFYLSLSLSVFCSLSYTHTDTCFFVVFCRE